MTRILAVCNQKGGVGKTATAVNISASLARKGRRTLLIDLDTQCNATKHVGKNMPKDELHSSYALLSEKKPDLKQILQPIGPNWSLIPAHIALAEIDIKLFSMLYSETKLKKALQPLHRDYDYIIIDCPPSLSLTTVNALVAATHAIATIQTNLDAYEAVKRLMGMAMDIIEESNPALEIYALATLHRKNVNIHKDVLDMIKQDFQDFALKTFIPHTATFAEARVQGQSIGDYADGSEGHKAYEAVTKEILARIEQNNAETAQISNTA